jgi:uncharacterized damage-inducible protein DinB
MRVADLGRLHDYGYWANARLFDMLAGATPDEFTRCVAGGHASVRNTLVHILSAEWGWLERCGGLRRGERLRPELYPTPDSVRATWTHVEGHMRGLLAGLTDAALERRIAFSFGAPERSARLGDLLRHAGLHAIHHRGQIAMLLRMLGHGPGSFDFLEYAASEPA